MAGRPTICWDSCVLIALLMNETRPSGEMEGVFEWARKIDEGEAVLVVSSATRLEILPTFLDDDQERLFDDYLRRSNVMEVEVGARVIEKARDLRHYYQERKAQFGRTLGQTDALHLATAILYDVDEFHTFDERGKRGTLGLIPLSGEVAGHPLTIRKPLATQFLLDLGDPASTEED